MPILSHNEEEAESVDSEEVRRPILQRAKEGRCYDLCILGSTEPCSGPRIKWVREGGRKGWVLMEVKLSQSNL